MKVVEIDRRKTRMGARRGALGKRIILLAQSRSERQAAEIIGVARHVQFSGLRADDRPQIYMPYRNNSTKVTMVIRTKNDPLSLADPLRKVVETLGGKRPGVGYPTDE